MRRPEVVERIKQALREVAPTATVILYGSEARGDARPDSDIDLLILVDSQHLPIKEQMRIAQPLCAIEATTGVMINPDIRLLGDWGLHKTPYYVNISKEGIRLQ